MTTAPTADIQIAITAASAAAAVLPAAEPLTAGTPLQGGEGVAEPFAGAVVADLEGDATGRVAVLVGDDLVTALASSPLGGLDLAAAIQPTLDAFAEALGARVGAARQLDPSLVVGDVGFPFVTIPLNGTETAAAILVPEAVLLDAAFASPAPSAPAPIAAPVTENAAPRATQSRGIEMLHGVDMEVTVEIGRARMTVRELLDMAPGTVLELDRAAGSPADLLVNGRLIARGEVVVIDEDYGLRITEILTDGAAS
ncbi:flagellar motor switch protein FliN [Nocardioides sp. SR21]|uniref:flagellar motor switch protein FliN n=1 Tax=Nocardioides sp. SR21 TaxID=2919501 RepID=UPI001FAB21B0|nr:flagellar motor switch protein FliN [Nocardioides sp. SR21]